MKKESDSEARGESMGREELLSALFANMIAQQTQTASMFLGRIPHPETGQPVQDFETAEFLINQLEMLEVKTKGNLSKEEEHLLKQSLTGLRMAFVEAVDGSAPRSTSTPAPSSAAPPPSPAPTQGPAREAIISTSSSPDSSSDESRKKFSKKY